MKEHDQQPSAPTRCSHDCATGRKKPVRSEATRHSHGLCRHCHGKGAVIRVYWNDRFDIDASCLHCGGTGRANAKLCGLRDNEKGTQ